MYKTLNSVREILSFYYPDSEVSGFIKLIINHLTGSNLPLALLDKNTKITEAQKIEIENMLGRLKTFEPIQYIMGRSEFYGLPFYVDKNVLIPRQETEELVDLIISNNAKSSQTLSILDIGTGSGCIAIALKKNIPNSEVEAWDISENALNVAKKNSKINNLSITFNRVDILANYPNHRKFNIIVSNPPYILDKEKADMEQNVLGFEPHNALFVPDDNPLLYYERIAEVAKEILDFEGKLYFEINRNKGAAIVSLLSNKGFSEIKLLKDISTNDRIIEAQLKHV